MSEPSQLDPPLTGPQRPETFFVIGRLGKPHGVRGHITFRRFRPRLEGLFASDDQPESHSEDAGPVELVNPDQSRSLATVKEARWFDDCGAVLSLAGVTTRDQAEALRGSSVAVLAARPPPMLCDGLDGWLGALAVEVDGERVLGRIVSIQDNGAHPIMVVRADGRESDSSEILVPVVDAFVAGTAFDPKGELSVLIRPIPGLLSANASGA